jgi:hypothetical protein
MLTDHFGAHGGGLHFFLTDPEVDAIAEFKTNHPEAGRLVPMPERPIRRFDCGAISYPRRQTYAWQELAERHASGKWGSVGEFEDVTLTDELVWSLWSRYMYSQNSVHAKYKSGSPILSTYDALPVEPGWGKPVKYPHIVTFSGKTWCWIGTPV